MQNRFFILAIVVVVMAFWMNRYSIPDVGVFKQGVVRINNFTGCTMWLFPNGQVEMGETCRPNSEREIAVSEESSIGEPSKSKPSKLKEFRANNPEYDKYTDDSVTEALYEQYYSEYEFEGFKTQFNPDYTGTYDDDGKSEPVNQATSD